MKRRRTISTILAAICLGLIVGVYWAVYLGAGEMRDEAGRHVRVFIWHWQATLFTPAAAVESLIREQNITIDCDEDIPLS